MLCPTHKMRAPEEIGPSIERLGYLVSTRPDCFPGDVRALPVVILELGNIEGKVLVADLMERSDPAALT